MLVVTRPRIELLDRRLAKQTPYQLSYADFNKIALEMCTCAFDVTKFMRSSMGDSGRQKQKYLKGLIYVWVLS